MYRVDKILGPLQTFSFPQLFVMTTEKKKNRERESEMSSRPGF